MSFNRPALSRLLVLALLTLLFVAACSPLPARTPAATITPLTTPGEGAQTPLATFTPSPELETPVSPADTSTVTTTPPPAETALATVTSLPTGMPLPTNTLPPDAQPATSTPTSTNTPAPPTNTPVPPSPTFTPTAPPVRITDWRGEYFANRTLQAPSVLVRNDRVVDFDLAAGQRPAPQVPGESWSARWTRDWTFDEGNYRFSLLVDDGARLWVRDRLIIDAWTDGAPRQFDATLYLRGSAPIRLEYYNNLGAGRVRLNWDLVTSYPDWQGSYYAGLDMGGAPYFQRNDPSIDFNWGAGAPRGDMPADNFAVRWSRRLSFDRAGTYRFQTVSDDGLRLWVDGRLIIDAWQDGYNSREASMDLAAGGHDLRLDYYERSGGATVRLNIAYVPGATATFTPTPAPATATNTPTSMPLTVTPPPVSPTPTFTPSPEPGPGQAQIRLEPAQAQVGQPVTVIGSGWPGGAQVDLFLSRPGTEVQARVLIGRITAGGGGRFEVEVRLPPVPEMRSGGPIEIVAVAAGGAPEARATFQVVAGQPQPDLPGGVPVPTPGEGGGMGGGLEGTPAAISFQSIPATEQRFAQAEPTFLALDSAEAWTEHFGPEPPPADPPIQWDQEYLLVALLGPQPAGVQPQVQEVMRQGDAVIVHLNTTPLQPGEQGQEGQSPAGVLLRLPRSEVRSAGAQGMPVFVFLDAQDMPLAQGPAGSEPLPTMMAKAAPFEAPSEPGVMSAPDTGLEQGQTELAPPEAGAAVPEEAERAQPEDVQRAQPAESRSLVGWLILVLWLLAVVAVAAGIWWLVRRISRP